MRSWIQKQIEDSIAAKQMLIDRSLGEIESAGRALADSFRRGGKTLFCGNGGSAADAQHLATEFSIRYRARPERPSLPSISLAADSSAVTACGNDFGFDQIFARQVEGLGRPEDAIVGITTSGNSLNVIAALRVARQRGMCVVALSGGDGGLLAKAERASIDHLIVVPAADTARIQECHIMLGQILCAIVEKELYGFD
ncbi:MAG: D-sedoheptulose 7-phosphate isomerase [Leptospirales bacterium]|nr:D-sedoheptulose 7-phosphate isomerase [Leptospirales bacterium]